MEGNNIPVQSVSKGPWSDDAATECGSGSNALCNLLLPLRNLLTGSNKNKDNNIILQLKVDQKGSLIEEGSTLTGMIEVVKTPPILVSTKTCCHLQHVQLILKGTEHCLVEIPTDDHPQYIQGKHVFLQHTFTLLPSTESTTSIGTSKDEDDAATSTVLSSLRYNITIPKNIPNSMPKWSPPQWPSPPSSKQQWSYDHFGSSSGHCSISYEICAMVKLKLPGELEKESESLSADPNYQEDGKEIQQVNKYLQSIAIPLNIRKLPVRCHSMLTLTVGPPTKVPVTGFCSLCTYDYRDTYKYRPSFALDENDNKESSNRRRDVNTSSTTTTTAIHLYPGQSLEISIIDDDATKDISKSSSSLTTTTTTNWRSNVVQTICKLTQRIKWSAHNKYRSSYTPLRYQSWQLDLPQVDCGTIKIPKYYANKLLRMTHVGKTIQIYHELVIYSYDKNSKILGTSPPIPVILSNGYTHNAGTK